MSNEEKSQKSVPAAQATACGPVEVVSSLEWRKRIEPARSEDSRGHKLHAYVVEEGAEHHLVIAEDEAQARGIAIAFAFSPAEDFEPGEWVTDPRKLSESEVDRRPRIGTDGYGAEPHTTLRAELDGARREGKPRYVGGSVW